MSRPDEDETMDTHTPDDYLWDRSGTPDETTAALEGALARHRWQGRLPGAVLPAPTPSPARWSVAAGLLLTIGLGIALAVSRSEGGLAPAFGPLAGADAAYRVEVLEGAPDLQGGRRIVTDADSRALVMVGDIGEVVVGPHTRLRVDDVAASGTDAEYLLYLERGSMTASIFAAPRLFQVGTPGGLAVDMGCEYSASVDSDGTTRLAVLSGVVSFETPQRRVTVPAGASTRADPRHGPGTPVWDDSPADWQAAVLSLDAATAAGGSDTVALERLLAAEQDEDTLTLFHLLDTELPRADRGRIHDVLAAFVPPPPGVTRTLVVARDADALELWKDEMSWSW